MAGLTRGSSRLIFWSVMATPKGGAGGRVRYSNLGYVALGELISRVTGQRYEDYVREHILQPLRMTRTDFAYDAALSDDVSTGHHPRAHPLAPVLRRRGVRMPTMTAR